VLTHLRVILEEPRSRLWMPLGDLLQSFSPALHNLLIALRIFLLQVFEPFLEPLASFPHHFAEPLRVVLAQPLQPPALLLLEFLLELSKGCGIRFLQMGQTLPQLSLALLHRFLERLRVLPL